MSFQFPQPLQDSSTKESFQSSEDGRRITYRPALCFFLSMAAFFSICDQSLGFRPLKDKAFSMESTPWLDEHILSDGNDGSLGPYPMWNISGTYKGKWWIYDSQNTSVRPPNFYEARGNAIVELLSLPTKVYGVHYVQGEVLLRDGLYLDSSDLQMTQMKMEGVYVWPFRQLRMVLSSPFDGDLNQGEDLVHSNPYHMVLQESPKEYIRRKGKKASIFEMAKNCKIQLSSDMSVALPEYQTGVHEHQAYRMQGILESPMVNGDGECFSSLVLNATSVNVDAYYNKAVNYTLMVTFISFLQVLILIKQMEHSNSQSGAAKVSLLMIGQQAIMDAYLCLLHLTAGILVESLFNAFATAAFFKFVIFSIFEMRYLLAIWKARRPLNSGEGWETMRRELSVLYSRFYGVLLGGILIMYEFHSMLRYILFLFYSFWIPQIVMNAIRDIRKPLHPYYILWMTITRLAIPLYAFGCPKNFLRLDTDFKWCISLAAFLVMQSVILLLQHYFGARWFIPQQLLPEKYCYFRRVDHGEHHNVDCVICMAAVETRQHSSEFMVTPCEHFFHAGCLQRWMDIKMECPTCRRPLPPL